MKQKYIFFSFLVLTTVAFFPPWGVVIWELEKSSFMWSGFWFLLSFSVVFSLLLTLTTELGILAEWLVTFSSFGDLFKDPMKPNQEYFKLPNWQKSPIKHWTETFSLCTWGRGCCIHNQLIWSLGYWNTEFAACILIQLFLTSFGF